METNGPIVKASIWGELTDHTSTRGIKVRLAQVFRKPGGSSVEVMNEIRALTPQDLLDLSGMFCEAGYPTSISPQG